MKKINYKTNSKFKIIIITLMFLLIFLFFLAFLVGRYKIPPKTVLDVILSQFIHVNQYWDSTIETVILDVRLPRILGAIIVGGALSLSGASYQTLFKNPLVSPDILGVSAGAGFGAALAMIFNGSWWEIQLLAFVFGISTVIITYLISKFFGDSSITLLVLAGVAVSGLFQAFISILKYLADPVDTLPSITFWLMGSLGKITNKDILYMQFPMIVALIVVFVLRHYINTLAAGEDEAATMGVNVSLIKGCVVLSATLMTVSAVSVCGIVGWVGLIIPHMARMLIGASYSKIAPTSFLLGGIFLLVIDNIARGMGSAEIPLGVLTALVGTPVFVILLSKVKKGW